MADVFDKAMRSAVMSKVRSKGNKSTELRLIEIFAEREIKGWRRNYPVKGHPDFVFPMKRIAVFVDGCFWHGHDCRNTRPKQNEDFWSAKREKNKVRDSATTEMFERRGWKVLRVWECELKKKNLPMLFAKLNELFDSGE
ncbi:MAG: very short patch repair endonuclease [Lachnospiraceae bacterium]|nr:very short patch repair endonuclease [Lachnospiraceae bacterium]